MASPEDVRLRVVEALARNSSAAAISDPKRFTQAVAEIASFVLGSSQTEAEPVAEAETPSKSARARRSEKPDTSFLE